MISILQRDQTTSFLCEGLRAFRSVDVIPLQNYDEIRGGEPYRLTSGKCITRSISFNFLPLPVFLFNSS